ncbi:hypothetical protein AAX29_01562 [Aliarcobacter thereius]|uniref:Uncharacterized protein n=1 Tax=Aliarcobacter thereius TaxID=544718 RepID=A0A1C0B667_9BACT|nr:hypothetical protein [Aliarcobacter thereius]OCL98649.1 hypothetical protein AAX29_01562 [Aliarcobacter thereius]
MTKEKIMTELFEFSAPTYYKWKNQDKRKIIKLLDYAFSNDDLIEYLKTEKISKVEEMINGNYLLDLSMKFYKLLRHITNYKVAKRALEIIEDSFMLNQNKIILEKIAEDIYSEEMFFTSMKLAILNLVQKQEPLVLEYISRNRTKLELEFTKKSGQLKKTDFIISNIA